MINKFEKLSEYYISKLDEIRSTKKENNFVLYCIDNDLTHLIDKWDVDKNEGRMPIDVTRGSGLKIWWICEHGVSFQAEVKSMVKKYKCPCNVNSIDKTFPEVSKEWDYEKNGDLKPTDVSKGSDKKVWWKCKKGHTWEARVSSRCVGGRGCPYCSGLKVWAGYNDLATTNPELLEEWNFDKNIDIKPTQVSSGSDKKVWWKCKEGHEWQAKIKNRKDKKGCPYCANKKVVAGENDLATTHSELVKEWDFDKNIDIKPTDVTYGSERKVWWKCECGHSWQATINKRTAQNTGCPYCANKKVVPGENDLATTHPELVKEWDYEKNGDLKPTDITKGSRQKVWWKCKEGHEWQAAVYERTRKRIDKETGIKKESGTGCPVCFSKYRRGEKKSSKK